MNIFILDNKTEMIAKYLCDKHIISHILESTQMLSTAHWIMLLNNSGRSITDFKRIRDMKEYLYQVTNKKLQPPYKLTHPRHPCTIWTHQTKQNYLWHVDLCEALCKEYTRRYNKIHKSEQYVLWFRNNLPLNIKDDVLQDFPICMKDEYKISKDPVVCYKFYYIKDKSRFAKWKYTSVPSWYSKGLKKLNSSISCSSDKDEKPK